MTQPGQVVFSKMEEVVFGKPELMSLCRKAGLRLEREWASTPYDVHAVTGHHSSTQTYLFAR